MSEDQNASVTPQTDTPFEKFLISEYQNLAQAHFKTLDTISEFFKQYILIVSLPVSAAVVFFKPAELYKTGVANFLQQNPLLPLTFSLVVVAIGVGVLGYVVNLRFDAILYARAINGIRKRFYEESGLSIEEELRFRILPKWTHFPNYIEPHFFIFVVLTFAVVSTAYFYLGLYFYWWATGRSIWNVEFWLWIGLCLIVHFILYAELGEYRKRAYLRSRIIGIDIDGVLNQHRQQFAVVLASKTGKHLDPESIVRIPVREIPGCEITEDDEHSVFNWPDYWVTMPPATGAAAVITQLKNVFEYKVWIFSHRGWPQSSTFPAGQENDYWLAWRRYSNWAVCKSLFSSRIIRNVTKDWLKQNGFKYDKLIIERGNTDTRDRLARTRNRYISSAENTIRFFVEDSLDNAKKLADTCEVVFLIDQPYNRDEKISLPSNVVRVKSWHEIHLFVRKTG